MKQRKTSGSPTPKTSFWRRLFRKVVIAWGLLFTALLIGTGITAGYVASMVKKEPAWDRPALENKLNGWTQTSHAWFRDRSPIGTMRADADRKLVKVDEVNPLLIDALISTEDKDFYRHHGIVPRSVLRAAYQYLTRRPFTTGGSTITQQLVKNTVLENRQKAIERKIREMIIALRMERLFSKEEILTYYLNSLFFGKGANQRNLLGVQAAAKGIFGVDAKDLNLVQSAYLAGMIQRPNAYNPYDGDSFQSGKKRMKTVLKRMLVNGKITPREFREALDFDLKSALASGTSSAYSRYPYVMTAVEKEAARALMEADGWDAEELSRQGRYAATLEQYRKQVLTGGYHIHTTLDPHLHDALNRAVGNDRLYSPPVTYTTGSGKHRKTIRNAREQVGAALIDVDSGALLAFVGGRDFQREQTNHAMDARRQPGSTIKPLLDYGPALDRGLITPGTVLVDEPLEAEGPDEKTYKNQSGRYLGPVTAREALRRSLNIPAIKVLRILGVETGFDYLRKMDFRVHPSDGEASAIGGFTRGFTVEKMTAGYAMLARGGIFQNPHLIETITDSRGRVVYRHQPKQVRVLSPRAAYLVTDMLRDVVKTGTGHYIGVRTREHDLAGKTGTTQNAYDLWFVGYTPRIALGVWVGYDYNHTLPNDKRAKIVWSRAFQAVTRADPALSPIGVRFEEPEGLMRMELCRVSGNIATEHCRLAKAAGEEWVLPEAVPEEICDIHATERVISLKGKDYIADPRTPEDMVTVKTGVKPPEDPSSLASFPGTLLPTERDPRLSQGIPVSPHVTVSPHPGGVKLSWPHTGEDGIVGYRVYRDGQQVASIRLGEPLIYVGPPGTYSVRAVDVAGLESKEERSGFWKRWFQ